MIHPRQPKSAVPAHPMPTHEHVDLRMLQHVADVDRACDIGWRQSDRKCRSIGGIFRAEQFLVKPGLRPAFFDLLWLVCLRYLGHAFLCVLVLQTGELTNIRGTANERKGAFGGPDEIDAAVYRLFFVVSL